MGDWAYKPRRASFIRVAAFCGVAQMVRDSRCQVWADGSWGPRYMSRSASERRKVSRRWQAACRTRGRQAQQASLQGGRAYAARPDRRRRRLCSSNVCTGAWATMHNGAGHGMCMPGAVCVRAEKNSHKRDSTSRADNDDMHASGGCQKRVSSKQRAINLRAQRSRALAGAAGELWQGGTASTQRTTGQGAEGRR